MGSFGDTEERKSSFQGVIAFAVWITDLSNQEDAAIALGGQAGAQALLRINATDKDIDITDFQFYDIALNSVAVFPSPEWDTNDNYGNGNGNTVFRLREGIDRFLITDINNPGASAKAQSQIWVMSDNVSTQPSGYNHVPGGANVLYLDGHVEFVRYPGKPPVTRLTAGLSGG